MSLTIKASLYRSWNHDPIETRRFSIDQEVATSFTYLSQKLAQIFPDLEANKINIAYIDSDGDRVSISTDDELTEALSQFDGSIFRIRLKKKEGSNEESAQHNLPPWFGLWNGHRRGGPFHSFFHQQPTEHDPTAAGPKEKDEGTKDETSEGATPEDSTKDKKGPHHPGVICDGCSGSIYGKRFKCCQCPDYDLCEDCEGKGVHTDHDMFTIDKPACRPLANGPRGPGGWGGRPGGWGGHGQLGPFEFRLWGHPGRCGGGPWGAGGPQSGFGCGPWWQGCNGPCNSSQQQQQTEANTGGANEDMETTTAPPDLNEDTSEVHVETHKDDEEEPAEQ